MTKLVEDDSFSFSSSCWILCECFFILWNMIWDGNAFKNWQEERNRNDLIVSERKFCSIYPENYTYLYFLKNYLQIVNMQIESLKGLFSLIGIRSVHSDCISNGGRSNQEELKRFDTFCHSILNQPAVCETDIWRFCWPPRGWSLPTCRSAVDCPDPPIADSALSRPSPNMDAETFL